MITCVNWIRWHWCFRYYSTLWELIRLIWITETDSVSIKNTWREKKVYKMGISLSHDIEHNLYCKLGKNFGYVVSIECSIIELCIQFWVELKTSGNLYTKKYTNKKEVNELDKKNPTKVFWMDHKNNPIHFLTYRKVISMFCDSMLLIQYVGMGFLKDLFRISWFYFC